MKEKGASTGECPDRTACESSDPDVGYPSTVGMVLNGKLLPANISSGEESTGDLILVLASPKDSDAVETYVAMDEEAWSTLDSEDPR